MRDRMERFAVLPFSFGCVSQASVDVAEERPKRSRLGLKSPSTRINEDEYEESLSGDNLRHSSRLLTLPRPNLSTGVNKIVKGFKSLSQLFMYEDEMGELGMKMEIGCPTDVKHVTHIGWDGTTTTNLNSDSNHIMQWNHLFTPELHCHQSAHRLPPPVCFDNFEVSSPSMDHSRSE
ncbi:hypothetical protein V2J09_007743 [Rumex salicifolius]